MNGLTDEVDHKGPIDTVFVWNFNKFKIDFNQSQAPFSYVSKCIICNFILPNFSKIQNIRKLKTKEYKNFDKKEQPA